MSSSSGASRKRSYPKPEVVIIMDHRHSLSPRSPNKTKGARKAHYDAILYKKEEEEDDEKAYEGLTKIEQMKLRARRRAERDERNRVLAEKMKSSKGRNGLQSGRYGEVESDEDGDLPILDARTLRNRGTLSSSLTTAPSVSQSIGISSSSLRSSNGRVSSSLESRHANRSLTITPADSQESNTPNQASQRSRRSTAKTDSYVFMTSLEPVSERRQKLQLAKQSAAVQAKLIDKGNFKSSVTDGKSDLIERVLRDHRKDQRKGYNSEALTRTIQMANHMQRLFENDESSTSRSISGDENDVAESSIEETDTSSSSDSGNSDSPTENRRVKFNHALTIQEREEERKRLLELMNEEDREGTEQVIDIILRDKESLRKESGFDVGKEAEPKKWSFWEVKRPEVSLETLSISHDAPLSKMLVEAVESRQESVVSGLLGSSAMQTLSMEFSRDGRSEDLASLIIWLMETSILRETSNLGYAALNASCNLLFSSGTSVIDLVFTYIPRILSKMGAKSAVISTAFGEHTEISSNVRTTRRNSNVKEKMKVKMRNGERSRAVGRLLQMINLLAANADAKLNIVSNQSSRLLEIIFKQLQSHQGLLFEKLIAMESEVSLLFDSAVVLKVLPCSTIQSRTFRRKVAYKFFVSSDNISAEILNKFSAVADILESKDVSINPLLATRKGERLHHQIEASLHNLGYILGDLHMSIITRDEDRVGGKAGKGFIRIIGQYEEAMRAESDRDDNDSHSAVSSGQGQIKIDQEQVHALHRIMEALRDLSGKIYEGKDAFISKSRVKDQFQRLRLMLEYSLAQYGVAVNKENKDGQRQATLQNWTNQGQ